MDGSVYNLNVPLDVDPKMYFRCTDLLQGFFLFVFLNESFSEKQNVLLFSLGWVWWRCYILPEIA